MIKIAISNPSSSLQTVFDMNMTLPASIGSFIKNTHWIAFNEHTCSWEELDYKRGDNCTILWENECPILVILVLN